jgi:predicted RNase H-like nuclease (RuvC/YqgF family)
LWKNLFSFDFSSKLSSLLEETLQNNTESDDDDDEELKMNQAQKVARLESSTKIYKTEICRLTQKIIELEEQMLTLEHKNGRLIMDSNQNVSLKGKIQKLQEGKYLLFVSTSI